MATVLFHQADETGEDHVAARLVIIFDRLCTVDDIAQIIEHGKDKCAHQFLVKVVVSLGNLLVEHLEVIVEHLLFLF